MSANVCCLAIVSGSQCCITLTQLCVCLRWLKGAASASMAAAAGARGRSPRHRALSLLLSPIVVPFRLFRRQSKGGEGKRKMRRRRREPPFASLSVLSDRELPFGEDTTSHAECACDRGACDRAEATDARLMTTNLRRVPCLHTGLRSCTWSSRTVQQACAK